MASPAGQDLAALAVVAAGAADGDITPFVNHVADAMTGRSPDFHHAHPLPAGSAVHVDDVVAAVRSFFVHCVDNQLDRAAVVGLLGEAGVPAALHEPIADVVLARHSELREALVAVASAVSHAHLADFDWSLRLVLSSDKLSAMRKQILVLKLYLRRADGSRKEVLVEMEQAELDRLLGEFGTINELVEQLAVS